VFAIAGLAIFVAEQRREPPPPEVADKRNGNPAPPRADEVDKARPPMVAVDFLTAVENNDVEAEIVGAGLMELTVTLKSRREGPLQVELLPGTLFQPDDPSIQRMVVRESVRFILLEPGMPSARTVPAACANMSKGTPGEKDRFRPTAARLSAELQRLTSLPDYTQAGFRVQQFAVWTVTDNPTRKGYTGIGMFLSGSGPDEEEFSKIRALLEKAGLEPTEYQAFGGRPKPVAPAPVGTAPPPEPPRPEPAPAPVPVAEKPLPLPKVLVPSRKWTDRSGRTMEASLISAAPDEQGYMQGTFERLDGKRFELPIGRLSDEDVAVVKTALRGQEAP
jgi:hypothetical protein